MAPLAGLSGIGLKSRHVAEVIARRPDVGFFEVHAENYMAEGGPALRQLEMVRDAYPLSLHGVGLSLGGEQPPDEAHLGRLDALLRRFQPAVFSEHLAWSSHGGVFYNDLLPVQYDRATLDRICEHIDRVQARLQRRMLLENPATYVEFRASTMSEPDFLREILRRTGCGLLLDISNAHVSCINHGRDASTYLDALPLEDVGHVHVAGFARDEDAAAAPLLIDDHGAPVDAIVWSLYERVRPRLGSVQVLVERDNDVPPLAVLLAEARHAQALLNGADVVGTGWRGDGAPQ